MKQILQSLSDGETLLVETPAPRRGAGQVLIQTTRTLVSLGTEKMLVDFGRGNWIAKARQQPEKVTQVLQKVRTDGLWTTWEAVSAKLDQPIPLGYCHVGRVREADPQSPFKPGQRVVSNGYHAEIVAVGERLVAAIPDAVSDDAAAYTVVAAIGLQGIRLLQPTLGERIVVVGLGLIGLLAVQMLRANGCKVLGVDFDAHKLDLARQFGAETVDLGAGQSPIAAAERWTEGEGVDGVLIAASTKSPEVIHEAATMCRKRGRIVLVGVVGLNLSRADFYEKELSFQVSCSYGPGRYDPQYEKKGLDYPLGFVRWTEQRNFQAVLEMMRSGALKTDHLTTHQIPFENATEAYAVVSSGKAMGILLQYAQEPGYLDSEIQRTVAVKPRAANTGTLAATAQVDEPSPSVVGFIGAGGFTTRMLLPALGKHPVRLKTIASAAGITGTYAARKHGFELSTTDVEVVLQDPEINTVFVTTPHESHAAFVVRALEAGKHVFVEKPLALQLDDIERIAHTAASRPHLKWTVGFNRRFSPHILLMSKWLASSSGSKAIVITINAGPVDEKHWTQDKSIGGGRIVGEACHFIDLARFLAGQSIAEHSIRYLGGHDGRRGDSAIIDLSFDDGSIASIQYLANGNRGFPKERIEVFTGGKTARCDNFRRSEGWGFSGKLKTWSQDKGHAAGVAAFLDSIRRGTPQPIPADQLREVSRVAVLLGAQNG